LLRELDLEDEQGMSMKRPVTLRRILSAAAARGGRAVTLLSLSVVLVE
jgi:hypothetical protein